MTTTPSAPERVAPVEVDRPDRLARTVTGLVPVWLGAVDERRSTPVRATAVVAVQEGDRRPELRGARWLGGVGALGAAALAAWEVLG